MQEPFTFRAPARLVDFMRQADEPGLINLSAGVPGLDALPFAELRQSLDEAFETDGASLFAYHHPEGDHALRSLLAERLRARGVADADGSRMVVTTGCTQALQGMLSVLVRPGDIVACEAPGYYGLLELLAEAGVRLLVIPVLPETGIDIATAAELLAHWKPKCLVVCTSLSNPTGASLPEQNRKRLVEICRENGVRLIEDDIYAELTDGSPPKPCRAFDDGNTVSFVTSFSKTVSPGLRIGYCVPGTDALHDAFAARKTQQDLHSSVITEATLRAFIAGGRLDPHLTWLRERNRHRRELALDAIGRAFPQGTRVAPVRGGYMLWVELPQQIDMARLREKARNSGVVYAQGQVFFATPLAGSLPASVHAMRLNCAKVSEAELEQGLEILGKIISGDC